MSQAGRLPFLSSRLPAYAGGVVWAVAITVLCLLAPAPRLAAAASIGDLEALRRHALELVNRAREQEGLAPLTQGNKANAAAQAHAEDMLSRRFYAHASPEGATVRDRYMRMGGSKWRFAAENIARCQGCQPPPITASVDSLQEGWMQSPLHRANILRQGITEFGFGIAVSPERGLYAVQVFIGAGVPSDLQPGEAAIPLAAEAQLRAMLDHINRARREADQPPLQPSPALAEGARSLLPHPSSDSFELTSRGLAAALPEAERLQWRSLAVFGSACGGCGEAPTEADIRSFARQWLQDERYRTALLAATATHLGFAASSNGEGKKAAVGLLGTKR